MTKPPQKRGHPEKEDAAASETSPVNVAGKGVCNIGYTYVVLISVPVGNRPPLVAVPEVDLVGTQPVLDTAIHRVTGIRLQRPQLAKIDVKIRDVSLQPPQYTVCASPGWIKDYSHFIVPGQFTRKQPAKSKEHLVYTNALIDPVRAKNFIPRGNIRNWKDKIGVGLVGNSRLIVAMLHMLSGPTIPIMNEEHFAIALVGAGGGGKTKVGAISSMVWGAEQDTVLATKTGLGQSLKSTINNFDVVFAAFNHLGLFLDEMNSIPGQPRERGAAIKQLIFSFADGQTKGRMTGAKRERWVLPLLVTANLTLDKEGILLNSDEEAAYLDRYIELPLPNNSAEIIENLHGFRNMQQFLMALISGAIENAGTPGQMFANKLAEWMRGGADETRAWLLDFRQNFMDRSAGWGGSPRLRRRFAVLYATGMAAIEAEVLPLDENDLLEALEKCLADHIGSTTRNNQIPADVHMVAQAIWKYFDQNKDAFPILDGRPLIEGKDYTDRYVGYRVRSRDGKRELLLTEETFHRAVDGLIPAGVAKNLLNKANVLAAQREGPQQRYSMKRSIGTTVGGKPWKVSVLVLDFDLLRATAVATTAAAN